MQYICPHCNNPFESHKRDRLFCGHSCASLSRHQDSQSNFGWVRNGYSQKRLEQNPSWKGNEATYSSLHKWIVHNWGPANSCEKCDTPNSPIYDWSNRDGKYTRDRTDWQMLCRSCHMKYDYANGLRGAGRLSSAPQA